MKLGPYTVYENEFIMDQRHKTVKLSEENTGDNILHIRFGNDFFDMTRKA